MKYIIVILSIFFLSSVPDGFSVSEVNDAVLQRIDGKSYPKGCRTPLSELRYLKVKHYDLDGHVRQGELICNKHVAADLVEIFEALYKAKYPIERMTLIDEYNGDDEASMTANNTTCFNYRTIKGSKRLSKHAQGLAIDINPLYNPCVKVRKGRQVVQPKCAAEWTDNRTKKHHKMIITTDDLCYKLFRQHGFSWGGAWRSAKDYQHFEKAVSSKR